MAVATVLGAMGQEFRKWRIMLVFGITEFSIPLLGMFLGRTLVTVIEQDLYWLNPLILFLLGAWSIIAGFKQKYDEEKLANRLTSWKGIFLLGLALSVDNLIIGFSLGLGRESMLLLASMICVVSVTFTYVGLKIGSIAKKNMSKPAHIVTGIILIVLAFIQLWDQG